VSEVDCQGSSLQARAYQVRVIGAYAKGTKFSSFRQDLRLLEKALVSEHLLIDIFAIKQQNFRGSPIIRYLALTSTLRTPLLRL